MPRAFLTLAALSFVLQGCGCGDGRGRDGGLDDGSPIPDAGPDAAEDAGFDAGRFGRPCEPGDDCDDGVDCTIDSCDEERERCRNQPDDHPCADEEFCNGVEVCHRLRGCVPGPPLSCSDEDVCTIDSCDEESQTCIHSGRDFDGDGHTDWHCEGGDDCDDTNARVFLGAREVCGDMFDNDCNGLTDDEEDCIPPGYDFCMDAVDLSDGGAVEIEMAGTFADYALSCGFFNTHDAVLTFTTDDVYDIDLRAEGEGTLATVALAEDCEDDLLSDPPLHQIDEVECNWGFPGRVRRRSLPAGTYFVVVATNTDNPVVVRLSLSEPTPPPTNESCDSPIDVSGGGVWEGSFVDVVDDHPTDCRRSDPELVYEFTLDEAKDVVMEATAGDGRSLVVAVQSTCGDVGTEIRCAYSAPADMRLYSLPPGTYSLLVESSSENDFVLSVDFEDPSDPPPGDTCADPVDVSAGGVFAGDLGDMQDDHETSCGFHYREMVFELTLDETMDLYLQSDSTTFNYVSVRTECDNRGTEQRCVYGNPAFARFRSLAADTYYVLVESFRRVEFDLTVEITDPVPIVDVEDNDVCVDETFAIPVPEGGVYRGDTTGMGADYTANCGFDAGSPDAAFRFVVDDDVHMEASLEGSSYNTVLHLHENTCNLIDIVECSDHHFGSEAFIERDLDAGTYFLVVDGFGARSEGQYLLDVTFEEL